MMLSLNICRLTTLQFHLNKIAGWKFCRETPFFVPFKVSALPLALAQFRPLLVTDTSRTKSWHESWDDAYRLAREEFMNAEQDEEDR